MKVSQATLTRLKLLLSASVYSSSYGRILHNEQPHIPIPGSLHRALEPFSKPFSNLFSFLTEVEFYSVDIAFVAPNFT